MKAPDNVEDPELTNTYLK